MLRFFLLPFLPFRWAIRLIVYGTIFGSAVVFTLYCVWMPGARGDVRPEAIDPGVRKVVATRLRSDVEKLAALGPRNLDYPKKLAETEHYLTGRLAHESGEKVSREKVATPYGDAWNLFVDLPGGRLQHEIVLVGAHYDTAPGTPGANDNASGVAILLEQARRFREIQLARTVRFALFSNEEPPHFWTETMGSLVHAKGVNARGENVVAMVALESLGHYTEDEGSQQYPGPLSMVYPTRGDFVAFVSNLDNRELVVRSLRAFRNSVDFPSEGGVFPQRLPGIGWSDHWSFWQVGIPAFMITDTAPFRDPNYHEASDRAEHLDFDKMAIVAAGVSGVVRDLTER